jgi:hypothetical protein
VKALSDKVTIMAAFFSVRRKGPCGAVVRARDPDAKQTLFGWGSDRRPSIEFYGRDIGQGGERTLWEWNLSSSGLSELRRNLSEQIKHPKKYESTTRDTKMAKALKKKLDKIASACSRKR